VNYQFDLKSSQLYMLIGGMVAVGLLLFLVGVIVGADSAASGPESVGNTQKGSIEPKSSDSAPTDAEVSSEDRSGAEAEARPPALPLPGSPGDQPRIYEVQLSAHLDQDATQPVIEELAANNLQPYVVEARDSRDRILYTVRIGPWDSMAEAAEVARRFRGYAGLDAYEPVIRHRPKPLTSNAPADGEPRLTLPAIGRPAALPVGRLLLVPVP
jgi:hypothetical protein